MHRLPLKELHKAVEHALTLGRRTEPFTDSVALRGRAAALDPELRAHGTDLGARCSSPRCSAPQVCSKGMASCPSRPSQTARARSRGAPAHVAPPKPPSSTNGRKPGAEDIKKPAAADVRASDSEVDNLLENSDPARTPPPEEDARKKVVDRLQSVSRLPPRHAELSTPVLLSIHFMYAELLEASSDEAREECIRESFPNEQLMAQALLSLIELLDPSIDVNDPVIRDADLESLIKVILFEERHRYEQLHPSQRPPTSAPSPGAPTAVPPLPPAARRTVPPPLPGSRSLTPPPVPSRDRG